MNLETKQTQKHLSVRAIGWFLPGSVSIQGPSRRFPICFHNTWLLQEAAFSFRPLLNHLLFCGTGSRQTGNVSSAPFPPLDKQSLLLSKVLWIFPKRRLDKYETICPSSFHLNMFCQIIKRDAWKIFSSRLIRNACVFEFEFRGNLAVELHSTVIPSPTHLSSPSSNF